MEFSLALPMEFIIALRENGASTFDIRQIGKGYRFNNSVTFSGKPIGSEEFLNRMVEVLDIIIYRKLETPGKSMLLKI